MTELIERMRAVAARTNDPLLTEAAAALEAAREDARALACAGIALALIWTP